MEQLLKLQLFLICFGIANSITVMIFRFNTPSTVVWQAVMLFVSLWQLKNFINNNRY